MMATISVKSNFILENKEFIYTKIIEQRLENLNNYLDNILKKHKGKTYREKLFSKKQRITFRTDILQFMKYAQDNFGWLSDERYYLHQYDELLASWTDRIKKFEMIIDMANLSNHVVLSDQIENEKFLIKLFREATLQ